MGFLAGSSIRPGPELAFVFFMARARVYRRRVFIPGGIVGTLGALMFVARWSRSGLCRSS